MIATNQRQLWELPAISIRQPWADLICRRFKDVENRDRRWNFRGQVLVHAGLQGELPAAMDFVNTLRVEERIGNGAPDFLMSAAWSLGGIVGVMTIEGCVEASASPWFTGPYGLVVSTARQLPWVRCRGMLGLFSPSAEERARMQAAWTPEALKP